jgi:hypothetical protein
MIESTTCYLSDNLGGFLDRSISSAAKAMLSEANLHALAARAISIPFRFSAPVSNPVHRVPELVGSLRFHCGLGVAVAFLFSKIHPFSLEHSGELPGVRSRFPGVRRQKDRF